MQRKKFDAATKAKVALEAAKGTTIVPLGHHLLEIPVAQLVSKTPAHALEDDLLREPAPLKSTIMLHLQADDLPGRQD